MSTPSPSTRPRLMADWRALSFLSWLVLVGSLFSLRMLEQRAAWFERLAAWLSGR